MDEAIWREYLGVDVPIPTLCAPLVYMARESVVEVAHLDCDACEKSTLNAVPVYVSPVPAVVVATPTQPWLVYARVCPGVPVNMVFVVVEMVSVSPPPRTKRLPVTVSAVLAEETVPVATEPSVVSPPIFVMYATSETAMSEVVAMAFKPVVEIVTFPVAPETAIPEPATLERTPVLLKAVPSYESPVPAVVVATHVGTPEMSAST